MKNCKIKCINTGLTNYLTLGKIYEVNNIGNFINDIGNNVNILFYTTLDELNEIFAPQFKLYVEPKTSIDKVIEELINFKQQQELNWKFTDSLLLIKKLIENYDEDKPIWESKEDLIKIIEEF